MDFKDEIKQFADRVEKLKDQIQTEEATKNSFIKALGYDVFTPFRRGAVYVADIGIKKGEKMYYAVMKNGDSTILVERKHWEASRTPTQVIRCH